jgi:protein subunit release factor B
MLLGLQRAGGQKINKTSNKVILLHIPTQLRVECQVSSFLRHDIQSVNFCMQDKLRSQHRTTSPKDTRSLQQNRKIARKRLQLKLDDLLHGNASRSNQKASKAATKKSKTKARNKRRLLKKMNREDDGSNDFKE